MPLFLRVPLFLGSSLQRDQWHHVSQFLCFQKCPGNVFPWTLLVNRQTNTYQLRYVFYVFYVLCMFACCGGCHWPILAREKLWWPIPLHLTAVFTWWKARTVLGVRYRRRRKPCWWCFLGVFEGDLSFERLFLFVNDLKIDGFYRSLTNSSVNFYKLDVC